MSAVRVLAASLCAAGLATACAGNGGESAASTTTTPAAPSTSLAVPAGASDIGGAGLDGVVLARALIQDGDLPGFDERIAVRPFRAEDGEGLLLCNVDLRSESGLVDGVQSVFAADEVQVTTTVSAAADATAAAAFVTRFRGIAESCPGPWTQEAPLLGVEVLEGEILSQADVGEPVPDLEAVRIRTMTEAGSSDAIAVVLAVGPVVTAVTIAGPAEDPLDVASEAVAVAAERAAEFVAQLG